MSEIAVMGKITVIGKITVACYKIRGSTYKIAYLKEAIKPLRCLIPEESGTL